MALAQFVIECTRADTLVVGAAEARRQAVERLLSTHNVPQLLDQLRSATATEDDEQVSLLCQVLSRVLAAPGLLQHVSDVDALVSQLCEGLGSEHEPVRQSAARFFLDVVQKRVDCAGSVIQTLFRAPVLHAICRSLFDESTVVGETAVAVLSALAECTSPTGVKSAEHPAFGAGAAEAIVSSVAAAAERADGVVLARIMAVICAIAGKNDDLFNLSHSVGLLERVASLLEDDDVLLIVSVLSLLPPLVATEKGLAFFRSRILHRLQIFAGIQGDDAEFDALLGPTAVRTIAETVLTALSSLDVAHGGALVDEILPGLKLGVVDACRCPQDPERLVAFVGALSQVAAASPGALDAVLSDKELVREWLECGVSSDPNVRASVLTGVAIILQGATSTRSVVTAATSVHERYEQLFDKLGVCCGQDATAVALASLRSADQEPRLAAYQLITAAVGLTGGGERWLRRVFGADGVSAYLLDRGTESAAGLPGLEAKWAVLAAALRNPAFPSLGEPFVGAVRHYVEQGACVPTRAAGAQVLTHSARH